MVFRAFLSLMAAALVAASLFAVPAPALALDPVADTLSRLSNRGRVLGTHMGRDGNYEVRILTPDDRIELHYVNPRNGRIVGGGRPPRRDARPQRNQRDWNRDRPRDRPRKNRKKPRKKRWWK